MSEQVESDVPSSLDEELLTAAIKRDLPGLKLALEKGANAAYNKNIPGVWGAYEEYGPIHKVLDWEVNKLEGIELLLKYGADVNARYGSSNWKGSGSSGNAFEIALISQDPKLIALFLSHGADPNTCQKRQAHTMRYDGSSCYPYLYLSAKSGNVDLLTCLLENGANPNLFATNNGASEYGPIDDTKELPIHAVCKFFKRDPKKSIEMIRLLLKYGSDVNSYGGSVQQVPNEDFPSNIEEGSEEYYEISDPRSDNYIPKTKNVKTQYTPLHLAITYQNEDLYNFLMANGANSSIPFIRNGVEISTLELKNNDWNLIFEWSSSIHSFLPPSLKKSIEALHKCSCHQNWPINIDVLSIIYTFICLEEFYEMDQSFKEFREKEKEKDSKRSTWY